MNKYSVLHEDGSVSNKTWASIEDIKLSINQGRLRYWPESSLVLKDNGSGYKEIIGTLGEFKPERTTCPHCKRSL